MNQVQAIHSRAWHVTSNTEATCKLLDCSPGCTIAPRNTSEDDVYFSAMIELLKEKTNFGIKIPNVV